MSTDFPEDSDGDALRRVAGDGSDMSKPMDIDFAVAVPDEPYARRVAKVVAGHGYAPKPAYDDEEDAWTVYCTKRMLATHDDVLTAQAELDALSHPFGGSSAGWGTFGNTDAK